MNELLDTNILRVISVVGNAIQTSAWAFMALARNVATLLVLLVIAREAFNLMTGNKQFDLLWWLRPMVMVIIISSWTAYPSLPSFISITFGRFERSAERRFTSQLTTLDVLKKKKSEALDAKHKELLERRAEAEAAKKGEEGNAEEGISLNPSEWMQSIKQGFEDAKEQFKNGLKLLVLDISNFLDKILEFIGNFIWRVALYSTLMIKEISLAFLFIFGPLSFALSVYDPWRDAWAQWVTRYISFQFYGFVAYHIMTASLMIISYGVQNDIKVLSQPGFPEAFSFSAMYTLFGYLVGAFALKIVPEVVSWVVPTNTSQAASQFTSGVSGAITGASVGVATYAASRPSASAATSFRPASPTSMVVTAKGSSLPTSSLSSTGVGPQAAPPPSISDQDK